MKLFATKSAQHIAERITLEKGICTTKQFSDGELFVRIDEDVQGQHVWVLAGTQAPADNLLEFFFLCNALLRAGAHIHAIITYLSYVRQIVALPGEAHTAEVITNFIKYFPLQELLVIHPHSMALLDLMPCTAIRDTDFFCKQAELYDAIAAPDKGATAFAREIAAYCNKELILLSKTRPEKEQVAITAVNGDVAHKKILLVDDIISTGRTLAECAHALAKRGATSVSAAATHGVFSPGSYELLEQSPLEKITVTNTIAEHERGKIAIVDTSPFIQKIILAR
jgi:ribose-phosphate pyrophosphokinase